MAEQLLGDEARRASQTALMARSSVLSVPASIVPGGRLSMLRYPKLRAHRPLVSSGSVHGQPPG